MRPFFCCLMSTNVQLLQIARTPRRRRSAVGARAAARTKQGALPPERPIHHFRIVNLRSLYSRDRWPPPRPALTIFVRLLPRLLDPVHGPVKMCEHACSRVFGHVAVPLAGNDEVLLCSSTINCTVVQHRTMRRGTIARITMLAGVAKALLSRGAPRVARPARQLRSSAPLRMAASTLEGLRNVAIVAHVP